MSQSETAKTARSLLDDARHHEPGTPEHAGLVNAATAYAALAQASALEALIDRTESIALQLVELRDDLAAK